MGRINIDEFRKQIIQQAGGYLGSIAYGRARDEFEKRQDQLLEEFNNHEVTTDIEEGPDSIGAVGEVEGNWYSFIGFEGDGEAQIEDLRTALSKGIYIQRTPQIINGKTAQFQFGVYAPSEESLEKITPMPWGKGTSWIARIEKGIPGLNKYMFDIVNGFESSRSGPGLQANNDIEGRGADESPRTEYVLTMLRKFIESFSK